MQPLLRGTTVRLRPNRRQTAESDPPLLSVLQNEDRVFEVKGYGLE
jgi:hypothetical protein